MYIYKFQFTFIFNYFFNYCFIYFLKSYEENHGYPAHLNKREFVEFLTFNLNQMGDEEVCF
jgi:hypothetical protein